MANGKATGKPKPAATKKNKPDEPKDAKFKRLAMQRVNAATRRIKMVGNLANRQNYEYTDTEASAVCNAIIVAAEKMVDKFKAIQEERTAFTL